MPSIDSRVKNEMTKMEVKLLEPFNHLSNEMYMYIITNLTLVSCMTTLKNHSMTTRLISQAMTNQTSL